MTKPDDLYLRLAEPAAGTAEPGKTQQTASAKETLDNDREDLSLILLEIE
jgi:hypothetical protein